MLLDFRGRRYLWLERGTLRCARNGRRLVIFSMQASMQGNIWEEQ